MKNVLMLGSDFAPSSLPPAHRLRLFATYLPSFGFRPIVLTVEPRFYEHPVDEEILGLVPAGLEVIRTHAIPVRVGRRMGIGDIGLRSLWQHWRKICELCRNRRIDLLFISVAPYMPMALGRLAHAKFGIPYVIDYMDPWITESYWKLSKSRRPPKWPLAYMLSRIVEPFALRHVSRIVGVSKGTTDDVISRRPWITDEQCTEIPMGGEAADFDYVQMHPRPNDIFDKEDGLIHLTYAGACIPAMFGALRSLFLAIQMGLRDAPERFRRLRLHFVGTSYAPKGDGPCYALQLAKEYGVADLVDESPGRISYLASLRLMVDSHALILLGSDEGHYTASKVFPYILARRPILAILNEASTAVRILEETTTPYLVTFTSDRPVESQAAVIKGHLEVILALLAVDQPQTRWDAFQAYTAEAMTRRLAAALDIVIRTNQAS